MLDNIFLITDADGTLLTDDKRILDEDMAAIRRLTESGGLFTLATGRGYGLTKPLADALSLETPAVIFNGAAIYDFKTNSFLWHAALSKKASVYVPVIMEAYPTLGVEVLRGYDIYVPKSNALEEEHLSYGDINPIRCRLDEIPPDNWIKVLLVGEPHIIDEVIEFTAKLNIGDAHLTRSSPIFYEMLPFGVNKGYAFTKLLELMGEGGRFTVAAGDYTNDVELIQTADLGIAVANAHEIIKNQAQIRVCDNNSGAISEIVELLSRRPYQH